MFLGNSLVVFKLTFLLIQSVATSATFDLFFVFSLGLMKSNFLPYSWQILEEAVYYTYIPPFDESFGNCCTKFLFV